MGAKVIGTVVKWAVAGLAAGVAALVVAKQAKATPLGSYRSFEAGPPPDPPQPLPPAGYRRPAPSDVLTAEMIAKARSALANPIGTLLVFDGWCIQLEWHYHPPDGPVKPWGWHKGATIYIKL